MGHDLAIIVVQNLFFIGSYGIEIDVIHLLILFEHQCCVHYLNTNVICMFYCLDTNVVCLFVLFTHEKHAHDLHV
jgi:hypothetical protein